MIENCDDKQRAKIDARLGEQTATRRRNDPARRAQISAAMLAAGGN